MILTVFEPLEHAETFYNTFDKLIRVSIFSKILSPRENLNFKATTNTTPETFASIWFIWYESQVYESKIMNETYKAWLFINGSLFSAEVKTEASLILDGK